MNTYTRSKEFFNVMKSLGRKRIEIQTFDDIKGRYDKRLAANFGHGPARIQEKIDKNAVGMGTYEDFFKLNPVVRAKWDEFQDCNPI